MLKKIEYYNKIKIHKKNYKIISTSDFLRAVANNLEY